MASRKLTKAEKKGYISKILNSKLKPIEDKFLKEKQTVFISFLEYWKKQYEKKHQIDLNKAKPWIYHRSDIAFYFGETYSERIDCTLPAPYMVEKDSVNSYSSEATYKKDSFNEKELAVLRTLHTKEKDIKEYKQTLKEELTKIIMSCSTTNKLLEVFPEITKYISIPTSPTYLPVPNTEKLKQLLNYKGEIIDEG